MLTTKTLQKNLLCWHSNLSPGYQRCLRLNSSKTTARLNPSHSARDIFVFIFVMNPFPIEFRNYTWVLFLNLSVDIRHTHLMSLLTIMMLFFNFQTLSVSVVITPWRYGQDSSRTHLFWRKNKAMVFAILM